MRHTASFLNLFWTGMTENHIYPKPTSPKGSITFSIVHSVWRVTQEHFS